MAAARVTGPVLSTFRRRGTSGAGNAYDLTEVTVLNGDDVAKVTYDTADNPVPVRGEMVDVNCDLGVYRGEPALRYKAEWSAVEAALV